MSMRFTANTAYVSSTANLPPDGAWTFMVWLVQFQDTNTNSVALAYDFSGGDAYAVETDTDGTTWHFHNPGVSDTAFAFQPAMREPFCIAITESGTAVAGYLRRFNDTRWDVVNGTGVSQSYTGIGVGQFRASPSFGVRGAFWNFKCWDRALTPTELMIESQADYMVDTRDANRFWRLKHPGDLVDYGPHAQRRPTRNGAPQPSAWGPASVGLRQPYRVARRNVDAAVSAAGFRSRYYYDMIGQPNV